jgi:hypothetical protein
VHLGHVLKVFRELIRGFHDLLRQKPPSLDIIIVEFNLSGLPKNAEMKCGNEYGIHG